MHVLRVCDRMRVRVLHSLCCNCVRVWVCAWQALERVVAAAKVRVRVHAYLLVDAW